MKSPNKVPVAAFKLTEHLTQKLGQAEKTRKKEESNRVAGQKERLEGMLEAARMNRKQLDDTTNHKYQQMTEQRAEREKAA